MHRHCYKFNTIKLRALLQLKMMAMLYSEDDEKRPSNMSSALCLKSTMPLYHSYFKY